ncbi:TetR family transcriptional regulator [Aquabacterium sp.]|uniref:TetR family transcriptional regulator n=1 Tax=Aquabacterium sp. TaxID=1872578 RepID=UPI002C805C46|nr:TetR family transcriptional regulator [Aquabacterium sp.]HSW04062.1 TetR family transcriptional regulator [Aquabacterium sp.]
MSRVTPPLSARSRPPAGVRPDRRHAILLAAEKLFALRGFHAVSLRQIAEEAAVPLALVSYYFGAKHELFIAIFAHWNSTVEARLAALRRVHVTPGDEATLAAIVDAFVQPVLDLRASPEGEYYALLVARQLYQAVDEAEAALRTYFDPMAHAFIDALHAAMPGASRQQAAWCYQFMLGALLNHLSDTRVVALSHGLNQPADPAAGPLLMRFITGGLLAALAPPAKSAPLAKIPRPSRRRPAPHETPLRRPVDLP